MIRLLLIIPTPLIGSIVRKVFEHEDDFTVVDVITSVSEMPEDCSHIDVIGLHAETRSGNLLGAIHRIREHAQGARIVLLYTPGIRDVQLSAIEMGAAGYVEQNQTVAEMVEIVRTVHAHGAAINPDFARILIDRVAELHQEIARHSPLEINSDGNLTDRETEVLHLVSEGLSNAEIADQLYISVGTVKNHVHNILSKLEADSREQAGYWFRWQRQTRAAVEAIGNGNGHGPDGHGIEPQDFMKRHSLLAASQMPLLRTMLENRLEEFCKQLGWPVGHIYLRDEFTDDLVSSGIWYIEDPERFEEFRAASEAKRFAAQEGVVGNILFSPEPAWVADVTRLDEYKRVEAARKAGIRSGLFLPLFDGELVGAFEFYDTERSQPDPETVAEIIRSGKEMGDRLESHVEDPAKTEK